MPPLETASVSPSDRSGENSPPRAKTPSKREKLQTPPSSHKPLLPNSDSTKRGIFRRLSHKSIKARDDSFVKKEGRQQSMSWSRIRSHSPKTAPLTMVAELQLVEEDPVVALFEARRTQRVRFCLEGKQPTRDPIAKVSVIKEKLDSSFNIKTFMSRALFRNGSMNSFFHLDSSKPESDKSKNAGDLVWESADIEHGPEVVHTSSSDNPNGLGTLKLSYTEDPETRKFVLKCLNKGRRAQFTHFRYDYAVKAHVRALDSLIEAKYPSDHPLMMRARKSLNNAHHMLLSYKNSANIVKMGIKYEESGELVRALKMYTIAYRMRRDQLSKTHPSLVVLLNILGSIQIKRMELKEAMQIFELALKEAPVTYSSDDASYEEVPPPPNNLLARAVTYRDMGTIHEKWGAIEKALVMYHRSLDCTSQWKDMSFAKKGLGVSLEAVIIEEPILDSICSLQMNKPFRSLPHSEESVEISESGAIEVCTGFQSINMAVLGDSTVAENYNSYFPEPKTKKKRSKKVVDPTSEGYADVDIAMTLHQIAQMHRRQGQYGQALGAYNAALRGMKHALGDVHPNVAAILANIGNLQKEYGDLDAAYETYQEVLGIESYRLGFSHPEVVVSLHNVATIEAARGNYEHALNIYNKVHFLQTKLFGGDNIAISVTAACMGDVHERLGDLKAATDCYEEALKIKLSAIGRHNLEVARVLHKLGKLAFQRKEFNVADSYISRAVLIYRLNRLGDDNAWVFDAYRDAADVDAAMAMANQQFLAED